LQLIDSIAKTFIGTNAYMAVCLRSLTYSIKDVFDDVEAQKNIDFIKETHFYEQL